MSSTFTPPTAVIAPQPGRGVLPLLIGYAVLALLGGVLHRQMLSIAAIVLLLIALGLPTLRRRSGTGIALWLLVTALMLIPALTGRVQLALSGLPILILATLCFFFARTLTRGREPLIARCVRVVEGDERMALPGVARYTRGITVYWACVVGLQAIALMVLFLCARPGGLLVAFGVNVPFSIPRHALAWYPEAGCWAVLILAFALEYLFRRWYLRHLPHPSLKRFVTQLIKHWPQLLRDEVASG